MKIASLKPPQLEPITDDDPTTEHRLAIVGGNRACGVRNGISRCGQPAKDECEYCHVMVCEMHAEKHRINGETSVRCPMHALGGMR